MRRARLALTSAVLSALALGGLPLSCDLAGLLGPPYAGRWTGEDVTAAPHGGRHPILELTLGEGDYRWTDMLPDASGRLTALSAIEGAVSARGGILTLSIDRVGRSPIDSGGLPAGALVWSEAGSPDYDALLAMLPAAALRVRYSVSGAVLTLVPDLNGDDRFDEHDPSLSLTKS